MKKSHVPILLAIVCLVAGVAFLSDSAAQQAAPATAPVAHVAICDVQEIFGQYNRAKDLLAELNEKRQALQAEDEQRTKAIEALQVELAGLKPDSDEYQERLAEVERLQIDRTVTLQYAQADLSREHRRLTLEMYEEISQAVEAVAKERGFNLVLYRDGELIDTEETYDLLSQIRSRKLLYHDPSLDITADVLTRLNTSYRTGTP